MNGRRKAKGWIEKGRIGWPRRLWGAAAVLCLGAFLIIGTLPDARGAEEGGSLTFSMGGRWRLTVSPGPPLYDPYIADPLRPCFALTKMEILDTTIPETGENRYGFRMGGRYGLLRLHPKGDPDAGFQLDLRGAFVGYFDPDNSADNIGWDGIYGLNLSWTTGGSVALKLAMEHDSSHVGDEYMERTGRSRINYTREDWVLGASFRPAEILRLYGECGYGYDLRNTAVQEPWRVKGGVELEDPDRFWGGRAGYYAAVDIGATEERDWEADVTVQTGFVLPARRVFRTYRLGVEYRDGRALIGEFFLQDESYWAFGLWMDL